MLQTILTSPGVSNGLLKLRIRIPKGGRVATRLMYSLYEAQATSYSCDLTMFVRGKRVAQKRVAGDLGTWVPLEGEVDVDAGEGDLFVTFQCAGTRGSLFVIVDQIDCRE